MHISDRADNRSIVQSTSRRPATHTCIFSPPRQPSLSAVLLLLCIASPALASEWLYFASSGRVHRSELDGANEQTIAFSSVYPTGIVASAAAGHVYWAEEDLDLIRRAALDGTDRISFHLTQNPTYLAVDPAGGKLYWTARFPVKEVRRVNLDGTGSELLVDVTNSGLAETVFDIVLHISEGKMYVQGTTAAGNRILRFNLDGSGAEIAFDLPDGTASIALDPLRRKFYWTGRGKIHRSNLDGSQPEIVLDTGSSSFLHALAVDPIGQKVYWQGNAALRRANLDGSDQQVVFNDASDYTFTLNDDCNQNGLADLCETTCGVPGGSCDIPECGQAQDCNGNLFPDECDVLVEDCNNNGIPDACDAQSGTSDDCNSNGVPDECELSLDCNGNGVPDQCDVELGTSDDCDENGVPDECESLPDCNGNSVADQCDVQAGTSDDCNSNGIPDECESIVDCNGNQVSDICDVGSGTSPDCNSNGVPDECDVASGSSLDCNATLVPDECEILAFDCNDNAVPDDCDIANGTLTDSNSDGIPDECCPPPCAPDPLLPNTFGTCTTNNTVCDTVNPPPDPDDVWCGGAPVCEPCNQNRYLSFEIPATSAGTSTAIRIRLDSLHNPSPPPSGTVPDYTIIEGQDRYLNTVAGSLSRCCNPNSNPTSCNTTVSCASDADCVGLGLNTTCYTNMCPDSLAFATFFRCGLIGCSPEYRDWSDFAGLVTYATGSTVIPSSSYSVSHLAASCTGNEADCAAASAPLTVLTERWGNVNCSNVNNGIPGASDISRVTDKLRDVLGAFIKPRVHLRAATLDPLSVLAAQDIGRIVDAVKGLQYPFHIRCTTACNNNAQCQSGVCVGAPAVGRCSVLNTCTVDANCTGLVGAHTCSANGFCSNGKDVCTGECQP